MNNADRCIEYGNRKFFYRIVKGPEDKGLLPAVFISGAFQNMDSWKRFEREFVKRTTVILVDLPGTGSSDILPAHYGMDFLVGALERLFDVIGLKRAELLATSYGTPIAYLFTKKNPGLVSRLVLGGIMKRIPEQVWAGTEHTIETLKKGDMHGFAMEVIEALTYRENPDNIRKFKLVDKVLYPALINMDESAKAKYIENTLRLLHHEPLDTGGYPGVRTLVFTGEYDVYTSPGYCREIAASMPDSVFTTIKNADHMFSIQRFDVLIKMILDFFSQSPCYSVEGCNEYELFGSRQPSAHGQ